MAHTKSKPPRRKPGAGLGQIIPNNFPEDEVPTLKRKVIPEVQLLCPMCGGPGKLKIDQFNERQCPTCIGAGIVSRTAFDKYINEHPLSLTAQQLRRQKSK